MIAGGAHNARITELSKMPNGNESDVQFETLCFHNIGGPKIKKVGPNNDHPFDHPVIDFTVVPIGVSARSVFAARNCSNRTRVISRTQANAYDVVVSPLINASGIENPPDAISLQPNPTSNDIVIFEVRFTPTGVVQFDEFANKTVEISLVQNGLGSNREGSNIWLLARSTDDSAWPRAPIPMLLNVEPNKLVWQRGQAPLRAIVRVSNNSQFVLYGMSIRIVSERLSPFSIPTGFSLVPFGVSQDKGSAEWQGLVFDVGESKIFELLYQGGKSELRGLIEVFQDNQPRKVFVSAEFVGYDPYAVPRDPQ